MIEVCKRYKENGLAILFVIQGVLSVLGFLLSELLIPMSESDLVLRGEAVYALNNGKRGAEQSNSNIRVRRGSAGSDNGGGKNKLLEIDAQQRVE